MMEDIYKHAAKEAPRECCGLVIQDGDNEKYIPSENLHEDNLCFKIDGELFIYHQLNSKIKYVVHSHYGQDCQPSNADKKQCKEVGIPYLIVSYPEKDYTIIQP